MRKRSKPEMPRNPHFASKKKCLLPTKTPPKEAAKDFALEHELIKEENKLLEKEIKKYQREIDKLAKDVTFVCEIVEKHIALEK